MADDIRQWLEELELGKYAEVFVENEITLREACDLSDDDLKELGLPMGPRRRLIRAIADRAAKSTAPAISDGTTDTPATRSAAERRQLTVMFCDLVGSTAMSGRIDPEELHDVIRDYQNAVAGEVARYEGHVAKFMGDGVFTYFGWPTAYEDQAERAVRAGLAAITAVQGLSMKGGEQLSARVGVATGHVVVGDLVGAGAAQEEAVTGETPNLAARLQDLAAPNQLVIGSATRYLIGTTFELDSLGPQNLKGFSEAVPAWVVSGEGTAESRFDAAHTDALTQFVGREHELGLLEERWELAKGGEGQVVVLTGEAGIGKSRMLQALRDQIAEADYLQLNHQCSPHHLNSAFFPIIQRIEHAAGFTSNNETEDKLDKLESLLGLWSDDIAPAAPMFAALLSLPIDQRYGAQTATPQQLRDRIIAALTSQLLEMAQHQPILFIVEDAHWIDPSSEAFIAAVLGQITDAAVFVLITCRQEIAKSWSGHSHLASVTLNKLSRNQANEIANSVGGQGLAEDVVARIVARSDGVPLYVEELTKSVLEAGNAGPDMPAQEHVPESLQDSLVARLDRLGDAKHVAQVGAVIGREFSHDLLSAVVQEPSGELQAKLERLVQSGLVQRRGMMAEARYSFKHALVQDAAYETLLYRHRQELHAQIARALAQHFPQVAARQPELLAHHLAFADLAMEAVPYLLNAGKQASGRSALVEAIAHLNQGLKFLKQGPESPEQERLELEFCLYFGPALMTTKGYAAPEVGEVYGRARQLALRFNEEEHLFPVLFGLWLNNQQRGDLETARTLAAESLSSAESQSNTSYLLQGHHATWTTLLSLSELQDCHDHAARGSELYDIDTHRSQHLLYAGHDPGACALNHLAASHWFLGYPDKARAVAQQSMLLAERLDHPISLALTLNFACWIYQFLRLPGLIVERAEVAIALCRERNILPQYRASASILAGWALAESGKSEQGIEKMSRGIEDWRSAGQGVRISYFLALLAEGFLRVGQFERGLAALKEAESLVEESGEKKWQPEIFRLRGDLLLASSGENAAAAEQSYRDALTWAEKLQTRTLKLRAATHLARLLHTSGRSEQARVILQPVHDWFAEGFDTPDMIEAAAMLGELD